MSTNDNEEDSDTESHVIVNENGSINSRTSDPPPLMQIF